MLKIRSELNVERFPEIQRIDGSWSAGEIQFTSLGPNDGILRPRIAHEVRAINLAQPGPVRPPLPFAWVTMGESITLGGEGGRSCYRPRKAVKQLALI